jgi:hypothetical protein
MFVTYRSAMAYQEKLLGGARSAGVGVGLRTKAAVRAREGRLHRFWAKASGLWHVLGQLRKTRAKASFYLNEPWLDRTTQ